MLNFKSIFILTNKLLTANYNGQSTEIRSPYSRILDKYFHSNTIQEKKGLSKYFELNTPLLRLARLSVRASRCANYLGILNLHLNDRQNH